MLLVSVINQQPPSSVDLSQRLFLQPTLHSLLTWTLKKLGDILLVTVSNFLSLFITVGVCQKTKLAVGTKE